METLPTRPAPADGDKLICASLTRFYYRGADGSLFAVEYSAEQPEPEAFPSMLLDDPEPEAATRPARPWVPFLSKRAAYVRQLVGSVN